MSNQNITNSCGTNENRSSNQPCGAVRNNRSLGLCENVAATPVLTTGAVITKVPVVLAERTIQIDVESTIILDQPAIEIKRIRKNIFITQCRLLPTSRKLFLGGFIRKNIEYATAQCVRDGVVSGDIRHTTVNVPFECVTVIPFELGVTPVITPSTAPTEIQFFDPDRMGGDLRQLETQSTIFFNERIFCELVSATFNEVDIQNDSGPLASNNEERRFQNITEKLEVLLTIKLLQLQQVRVQGIT